MAKEKPQNPQVKWEDNAWSIALLLEDGRILNASWKPGVTYVVRIREAGQTDWSFGFETPITSFTFVDLKPDTEYELQVRTRNAAGEGAPAFFSIRTDPEGGEWQRHSVPQELTARPKDPAFPGIAIEAPQSRTPP